MRCGSLIIKEISHVSELLQYIEESQSMFFRNQRFLFRGESKNCYRLVPSVYRKSVHGADLYHSPNTELDLLTAFMTDAASYINLSPDDMFRWLQYAQHFGTPTRLLDWTANPLVALYFACSNHPEDDGKVYILNSFVYKLLIQEKNEMDGNTILEEAMKMIRDEEKAFPYPVIFKPYYFDQRMFAQSSEFMVWGYIRESLDKLITELEQDGKKKEYVKKEIANGVTTQSLEEIDILTDVFIKRSDKEKILWELDGIGINQARLFPGLDGIGRAIEWRNNWNNKNCYRK